MVFSENITVKNKKTKTKTKTKQNPIKFNKNLLASVQDNLSFNTFT